MAPNEQDPMPLENLPGYLHSKSLGSPLGGSPVVQMGQIVVPKKKSYKWSAILAALICMVGIGGVATYDLMSTEQFTVIVDMQHGADPYQAIPQIVSESGGRVLSVKHTEGSVATYEVEVATRKNKHVFLEWLLKDRSIKKAELEE